MTEVAYNFVLRGCERRLFRADELLGLDDTTPTRVALTLRVLRLARVSFYMKLINTCGGPKTARNERRWLENGPKPCMKWLGTCAEALTTGVGQYRARLPGGCPGHRISFTF